MSFVGGSVAVSGLLAGEPLSTAQALRYALASALLVAVARDRAVPVLRPRGSEWGWLAGTTLTGLVLFNVALVRGSGHAEPAVLGVAVAAVPLILALVGPLAEGRTPTRAVTFAAVVVTSGAALVQGTGRSDRLGLAWAALILGCEAAFTLLAVPVLRRHGAWGVSVHTTWMAAVAFAALGLVSEGPRAAAELGPQDLAALGYLAVGVTAVAFVLWYSCVSRLGSGRAGLLAGVAPVSAAATGVILGGPVPRATVWLGMAVVGAGLALGLTSLRPRRPSP